jgi:hypothetical protein
MLGIREVFASIVTQRMELILGYITSIVLRGTKAEDG